MTRRYGSTPLHLAAHVVALAACGWAILQLVDVRRADQVLLWFVAALVLHDLVLSPLATLLDRAAARATGARGVNYVRVPAAFSALLALVWFPTVLGLNDATLGALTGDAREDALRNWLALTAALFAAAGLAWLLRGRRAGASPPPAP